MRQVNLKILRGRLTEELKNLPFEITKNGKVVGLVSKGLNLSTKKEPATSENTDVGKKTKVQGKGKAVETIIDNQRFKPKKSTIATEETPWENPLLNSMLAPKK